MEKTTRDILFKAAHLIRTRGLAKHTQLAADGSCCLHGALNLAAEGRVSQCERQPGDSGMPLANLVASAMVELGFGPEDGVHGPGYGLAYWNNRTERTANEVITVLEYAASVHA